MKEISLNQFIAHFADDVREEKRFCFILGAGASKSSGIPMGSELVHEWVEHMKEIDIDDFNKWVSENNIDESDYPSYYSKIFDQRFKLSKKDGFAFLEKKMLGIEPSCGYAVLAEVLAKDQHNVVITTNFDSLTEDALFIYTQKKPLVVGHSSLAGYISANPSRPLVVKIHHDLFLSPKNSAKEIAALDEDFSSNLKEIFKTYTPLIIGYGGNDGSLMGFLEKLENIEGGLFWFYMDNGSVPKQKIQDLVTKTNGHFVRYDGFDQLMVQLGSKIGIQSLDKKIDAVAKFRIEKYKNQVDEIKLKEIAKSRFKEISQKVETVDKEEVKTSKNQTLEAIDKIAASTDKSWWSYASKAQQEKNPKKQNDIYKDGLREFPKSPDLLGGYADFLMDVRKNYKESERYYKMALKLDPSHGFNNGNYGLLLHRWLENYDLAETHYKKGLEFEPESPHLHENYAVFMHLIRKKYDLAEAHYKKAIEIDPSNALNNSNYAIFLHLIRKKYDLAEDYYQITLKIDPENDIYHRDYANFLAEIRLQFDPAEDHFKKALTLNPDSPENNGGYAYFLHKKREDFEKAEMFYTKSLELNNQDVDTMGNYAVLLHENLKEDKMAEALYQEALGIDPHHTINRGNYAEFLTLSGQKEKAMDFLETTIALYPNEDNSIVLVLWLLRYAIFPTEYPNSKDKVIQLLNDGMRYPTWNFAEVLALAKKENHSDYKALLDLALQVTKTE